MNRTTRDGALFALAAYAFWGVAPVYFKWVSHVPALEILAHRVVWALALLLLILAYTEQLQKLRLPVSKLPTLMATSLLLSTNWLLFIYAVLNNNITETSLGYYINPLVSVFLGVVFLKEGLRPLQWIAIAIVCVGILVQLIMVDSIPWIALTLALTFGLYGLLRKNLSMHAIAGLTIETALLTPVALCYLAYLYIQGEASFGMNFSTSGLLMLGGFVTSFPLLCFAAAVTRLTLTVNGMFQYLAPTIALLLAVFIYDEPFGIDRIFTFACIWTAVALFSFDAWYRHKHLQIHEIS